MATETLDCRVKQPFRLDLDEVSALCVRCETQLVAVGDDEFTIVTAALGDDGLDNETSSSIGDILDDELGDATSGSEWEAIAADGIGGVFIVKESSLTVAVLSPGLDEHVHTIRLDVTDGPDEQAHKLLDDENKGPEGILLLQGGHLLVVKQKKPVLLIEFGPREGDRPIGSEPLADLSQFELSKGRHTTLVPLHSWRLLGENDEDFKSANDLAVDDRGKLLAISSSSRSIYELPPRSTKDDTMVATRRWRLPDEMTLSDDRKAEGLTFDRNGHPVVAVDSHDKDENLFLLEPLIV